ncbi:MAG: sulfur carrier protein ThiS [Helicobacteraceae bacterium]|jgi:sulfur carrier protein|nr:sulfur carrier protein ThiS [Helicobacteraceae bacterium]
MNLIINDEAKSFSNEALTVSELLKLEEIERPYTVSVQLNDEFVAHENYATQRLKEGDRVNFLYFMGGGA